VATDGQTQAPPASSSSQTTLRQRLLSHRQQQKHLDQAGDVEDVKATGDNGPHRFSWAGAGKMLSNILTMSQDSFDTSESRTAQSQPPGAIEDFPMISPRSALIQGEAFREGQQIARGRESVPVNGGGGDSNQQSKNYGKKRLSHLQLLFPSDDIETPHVSIYVH
jgi:hypothetical protein